MKRLLFPLFITLVFITGICAQNKTFFILEDFSDAKVYFKNKTITIAPMNYDAAKNRMYFMQNNERMELTNAHAIDSIVWGGKGKFITNKNSYLEEVKLANGPAYIQWKLKDVSVGARGAFGTTTQGKVEQISLRSMGIYSTKDENVVDIYQQKNDNDYFLKINGELQKVNSLKQITKLLPAHKEEIEAFAKKRKTDMNDALSALQMLDYCLSLL